MPYCTEDHVRAVCDTDMTDAEITDLIEEIGAFMDLRLDTASLGALVNRVVCRTWVTYRCMLKDPGARGLGDYSENRDESLRLLKQELDEYMMAASGGIAFKYGYADLWWPSV